MKKFLALMIALTLMLATLASCGNAQMFSDDAQSLIDSANAVLTNTPYNMTVKMNFQCDNEEVNSVFSMMNMEIPVTVDGKNMAMDMSMDLEGYTMLSKIIIADMVMYYDMEVMGIAMKMKAPMTDAQYEAFMSDSNTEMVVSPEDFANLTVEAKGGKQYIACGEISQSGLDKLNDMLGTSFSAMGAEASISEVTYGVTLNDGKYESMDFSCTYSITVYGETVSLTFDMSADFSYDNVAKITAPADADMYEEMNFEEIMG